MRLLIVTRRDTTTALLIHITYKDIMVVEVILLVFWIVVIGAAC